MKNLTFYGDVAKALDTVNKKFDFRDSLKKNFFEKISEHKIALIVTVLSFIIPVSGLLNILMWLVSIVGIFKCFKKIVLGTFKETAKEKKDFKKKIDDAKTVLFRFNVRSLKLNGVTLSENNFKSNMKNIGTYRNNKFLNGSTAKEETINTYIKMKDISGKIHVLKQTKKQLLADGMKSDEEATIDYQLLTIKEADLALTEEKRKIRKR